MSGLKYYRQRYLSKKIIKHCLTCGKELGYYKSKYCSQDCAITYRPKVKHANYEKRYKRKIYTDKLCKKCLIKFTPVTPHHVFCSKKCKDYLNHIVSKDKRLEKINQFEKINPLEVFFRDGWICQYCKKKLSSKDRGKRTAIAPELDHIVPLSLGGGHIWSNLQLLCRGCNNTKKNKTLPDGEQVRLC